jgi:hypothetical protein
MLEISTNNVNKIVDSEPDGIDYKFSFFTPSTTKLVVMSIFTLGLYELYWFYKNWLVINNAGKKCNPLLRAFFAPLFAYACFWHIRESKIKNKVDVKFPIIFLSIVYFILQATWNLPAQYGLISFLSFLPIAIANRTALTINQAQFPGFISDNKFSKWNYLAIIFGGIMVVFVILGSFSPDAG